MTIPSKKYIAFIVFAALTLILSGCGMFHKTPEERAEWITLKIAKKLDLNDMQKVKLATLKDQVLLSKNALKEGKKKHHQQLLAMLDSPVLERAKLSLVIDETITMVQTQKPALISAFGDFYDSLTHAQRMQVKDKIQQHHAEKKHHWN